MPALYYRSHSDNSDSDSLEGRTWRVGEIINLHWDCVSINVTAVADVHRGNGYKYDVRGGDGRTYQFLRHEQPWKRRVKVAFNLCLLWLQKAGSSKWYPLERRVFESEHLFFVCNQLSWSAWDWFPVMGGNKRDIMEGPLQMQVNALD